MNKRDLKQRQKLRRQRRQYLASARRAGLAMISVRSPLKWLRDVKGDFAEFEYQLVNVQDVPDQKGWLFCQGGPKGISLPELSNSEPRSTFLPDAGTVWVQRRQSTQLFALRVHVTGLLPDHKGWSNVVFKVLDPSLNYLCGSLITPYTESDMTRQITSSDMFIVGKVAPWLSYVTSGTNENVIPLVGLVVESIESESQVKAAWERFNREGRLAELELIVSRSRSELVNGKTEVAVVNPDEILSQIKLNLEVEESIRVIIPLSTWKDIKVKNAGFVVVKEETKMLAGELHIVATIAKR